MRDTEYKWGDRGDLRDVRDLAYNEGQLRRAVHYFGAIVIKTRLLNQCASLKTRRMRTSRNQLTLIVIGCRSTINPNIFVYFNCYVNHFPDHIHEQIVFTICDFKVKFLTQEIT